MKFIIFIVHPTLQGSRLCKNIHRGWESRATLKFCPAHLPVWIPHAMQCQPYPASCSWLLCSAAGVRAVCQACLAMKMGAERFCLESTAEQIFQRGEGWDKRERKLWTLLLSSRQKWQKWGLMITWNHNFLLPNMDNECAMYSQFL